jgi:lipopolysaccharide/colanic/teichoic acid biosynthesis glycosyltransferase
MWLFGGAEMRTKRLFDIVVSALSLLLLSPVLGFVALLVKLDSAEPCIYRGRRVGKDGQVFLMFKFRTMVERWGDPGARITAGDDPRITRLGRVLRRTKLNELPQLVNVLRGEMSLVGPRPEDPEYVALYTLEQRKVLSVRPGITSPACIAYRDEESMLSQATLEEMYVDVVMPHKLRIDLQYVEHRSFLVDLGILFWTLAAVLPLGEHWFPQAIGILSSRLGRFVHLVPPQTAPNVMATDNVRSLMPMPRT